MRESGRSGRSCPASGRLQLAVIGYDFYVDGVKHNTARPRRRTRLMGWRPWWRSEPSPARLRAPCSEYREWSSQQCGGRRLNAAKRSFTRGNRRPPSAERTPQTLRLTTGYPAANHPKRTQDIPPHTDIAAYRCRALADSPYAGAAGRPARNGIWRRTAPPACYPIMGLVNQIRDTRVATVELFHAEPGSNRAPSRDVWRSVRAVPPCTV